MPRLQLHLLAIVFRSNKVFSWAQKLVETTACKYKHCLCGMGVYVWNDSFIFEALKTLINILEAVSLTGVGLGFFLKSHHACLPPHPTDLCCLSAMSCQPGFRLHGLSLSACFNELDTTCYKNICYKTIITTHPSGIHLSIELLLLNLEFLVQISRKILCFLKFLCNKAIAHSRTGAIR